MFLQHEFKRKIKRKNEKNKIKEKVKFTIRGESMGKYYYLKSEVFSLNSEKLFISLMSTASYSHDVKKTFF
jgi:predicted SprT family Zn-dependent metalloprotease